MTARARGTRKGQRADNAEEGALLELLAHGLSEDEIRRVGASAVLALDEGGRERLIARLGKETGGTLRRLLGSHGRSGAKARPSQVMTRRRPQPRDLLEAAIEAALQPGRFIAYRADWDFVSSIEEVTGQIEQLVGTDPERARGLTSTTTTAPSSSSASVIVENSGLLTQDSIDLVPGQLGRAGEGAGPRPRS